MVKRSRDHGSCVTCNRTTHTKCTICGDSACNSHCFPHPSCGWDACLNCRRLTMKEINEARVRRGKKEIEIGKA